MTLAAAYLIGKVPILLSDALVSGAGERPHQPIATRVDLEEPLPSEWMVPVTGLSRKSLVIGGKLAVASAGSGIGAAVICRKLQAAFSYETPDAAQFEEVLTALDDAVSDDTCCTLVGWLVDGSTPRSFMWRSSAPAVIHWGHDFVTGTGEALFRGLAWSPRQRDWPIESFDHAQHYALTQVSALYVNEITNGAPIQSLMGGGYDVWIWDGKAFRHGAEVSFLFLSLDWLRSETKTALDPAPVLVTQTQVEDCLVVRALLPTNQLGATPDRGERVAVIAPITAGGLKHLFSQPHDLDEIPHFGGRIFVIVTGTGPGGEPEHWAGGVDHAEAAQFKLERNPVTGKVRFCLPMAIIDSMSAAAERQFGRSFGRTDQG